MYVPKSLDGTEPFEDAFGHHYTIILNDGTAIHAQLVDVGTSTEITVYVFEVSVGPRPNTSAYDHWLMEAEVSWYDGEEEGTFRFTDYRDTDPPANNKRWRIHEMGVRRILPGRFFR